MDSKSPPNNTPQPSNTKVDMNCSSAKGSLDVFFCWSGIQAPVNQNLARRSNSPAEIDCKDISD